MRTSIRFHANRLMIGWLVSILLAPVLACESTAAGGTTTAAARMPNP